jgi:dUTP pyrophosphatase
MQVDIKRFDQSLPLPAYQTPGAAAMDLSVRKGGVVPPKGMLYLPLNIALKPPAGHFVLMAARSSLHKRGLMMANNVAIFDEDYCGDNDEYKVVLYNFTDQPVTVEKGDRLAQIVVLPYDKVEWQEVASLGNPDRGGYGTTGK